MDSTLIFFTQMITSFFVIGILVKWFAVPWLSEKSLNIVLMILIAPHAFRHIGLTFLVPTVTTPEIPLQFAMLTAWGDYLSAVLAMLALFALKYQWRLAIPIVWIFNIVGTADLLKALSTAEVIPTLGGVWLIPTMLVPLLLVTHFMIFTRLINFSQKADQQPRIA